MKRKYQLTADERQIMVKRLRFEESMKSTFSDISFLECYQLWVASMWHHHDWSEKTFPTMKDKYLMDIGLSGEVGEVQEMLKKLERDGLTPEKQAEFKKKLILELGDVLYYLIMITERNDIHLDEIIKGNVEKLEERYEKRLQEKFTEFNAVSDKTP